MTYNVFSGTLNPTQSIKAGMVICLERSVIWFDLPGAGLFKLSWKRGR